MDHQAFAELLGNYGEFVGAIAVVVTLAYLAVQIRQNSLLLERANTHADATSIYESQQMYSQCFAMLAKDGDLAEIYVRMLADEQLGGAEYVRATAFLTTYFVWVEKVFLQAFAGVGYMGFKDVDDYAQFFSVTGPHVAEFLETSTGSRWWAEDAPKQLMSEFRASVETYLSAA
jgi:hypothetical protein